MNGKFGLRSPSDNGVDDFIDDGNCGYKEGTHESSGLRWFSNDLEMLRVSSFYRYKKLTVILW